MNVAIIPARGGSKRVPLKNIKPFLGKPIISYSIAAAQSSGLFDRIVVSTDSKEIADVALKFGAEVPFMRPADLADDFTTTAPVLLHALKWLMENGNPVQYACCIYATAPFVRPVYLKEGFNTITEKGVSSVFSVTTFPFPIFRALKINEEGHMQMFWPEHELTRSNDLPEAYHDAGQFYWLNCKAFFEDPRLYGRDALPVLLPRYMVQDIDTLEDWEAAEHLFKALESADK